MTTPLMPKKTAGFYAAVRARGVLNTMLNGPVERFEKENPGMRCRWEYFPKGGDNTFVVARESMGFRLADYSQLGAGTESEQKDGEVRVGDLVLMYADQDLVNELEIEDAHRAFEDWKLPEQAYREHVKGIKVRTRAGEEAGPEPVGKVKVTQETVGVREPEHDVE